MFHLPFKISISSVNQMGTLVLVGVSVLIVTLVLTVLVYFDAQHYIVDLLRWFDSGGRLTAWLFILVMVAVNLLFVPGVFFTCGAGFVFGVVEGSVYVVLGTIIGASLAFLCGRHFFGKRGADIIRRHRKLNLLNQAMSTQGWKVVFFTRLIPFFPSKLANYFFGLTGVSFRGYFIASLVGFIPYSVHNVYLGSIVADISLLMEGGLQRGPWEWGVYAGGFVITVIALIYLTHFSRRALSGYLE